jgi:hypothetical protein
VDYRSACFGWGLANRVGILGFKLYIVDMNEEFEFLSGN